MNHKPDFPVQVVKVRPFHSSDFPGIFYVGHAVYGWRRSPLANPYRCRKGDPLTQRVTVVEQYATWLLDQLAAYDGALFSNPQQEDFYRLCEATMLEGSITLGCWCAPLLCHGHVLQYEIMSSCGRPWDRYLDQTPWALHRAKMGMVA